MVTGYEVSMYQNVERIARALERITVLLERQLEVTLEQREEATT